MPRRGGANTTASIRRAAIGAFYQRGYEATTLRDLATDVGIKVGSLYNHIDSKEDLLFDIMMTVMRDLENEMERALAPWTAPVDQLRAAVECHILFHAERAQEVFIGNSELRSLSQPRRAAVVQLRDLYERRLRRILENGERQGEFFFSDARLATYAIVTIGTHVSSWYNPRGTLTLEQISSGYADFILRSLRNPDQQVAFGESLASGQAVPTATASVSSLVSEAGDVP